MNKSNWKTTFAGLVLCLVSLAQIWAPADYQQKIQATAAALAGIGLVAAKDHNKA